MLLLVFASLFHHVASNALPQESTGSFSPGGQPNEDTPGIAEGPYQASGAPYGTGLLGTGISASATASSSPVGFYTLVPGQEADVDDGLFLDFSNTKDPQPIRGGNGGLDNGPRNPVYDRINSDLFARPGTDSGDVPNVKWPMGLSSAHSGTGNNRPGWARQQNIDELPVATEMAGVDMHLSPNAYRELHWHSANEWSYIFSGSVRVSAVNQDGQSYIDDLVAGDLWFFPAGVPHSIQAGSDGVEFLLVFDQGDFCEDGTDLVSELFLRNPREVLAKNFQTDVSSFDNLPSDEVYIFEGTEMPPLDEARSQIIGPAGFLPESESYTYHLSQQDPYTVPGGTVKIVDPTTFPIASNFSVGLFTIEPGAMRELHWHLTSDEWNFFLSGSARITIFEGPQASRTFDFAAGDVGYIPFPDAHYVENVGNETVVYLEVLQAPKYQDISVAQWLGLTPKQVVADTLHLLNEASDNLPKHKPYIVPGDRNLTTTDFTPKRSGSRRRHEASKGPSGYTRIGRSDW